MKALIKWFGFPLILILPAAALVFASDEQTPAGGGSEASAGASACVLCHFEMDADLDPDERMFVHFAANWVNLPTSSSPARKSCLKNFWPQAFNSNFPPLTRPFRTFWRRADTKFHNNKAFLLQTL